MFGHHQCRNLFSLKVSLQNFLQISWLKQLLANPRCCFSVFMDWKTCKQRFTQKGPIFYCISIIIFIFSILIVSGSILVSNMGTQTSSDYLDMRPSSTAESGSFIQMDLKMFLGKMNAEKVATDSKLGKDEVIWLRMAWVTRRLLSGPGSSPPRCTAKCGRCTPCRPVHVPVPPGTPVTTEYYPEAWRCKCGNKLYMP